MRNRVQLTTCGSTTAVSPLSPLVGADIALSPVDISDHRPFEFVCARARVGCFTAIVVLLYRPGSQPQQTFFDELTPVR